MPGSEEKTLRVRVEGLVQGVGFRAFVMAQARDCGVRGWVRNTKDGAVEVEAQADARALERFLLELRKGPRMARVEEMRVETLGDAARHGSFEMRW